MLTRTQWRASRQSIPYICPACRIRQTRRHYTRPREEHQTAGQDDTAVVGTSKEPTTVSSSDDLIAILNKFKRSSEPQTNRPRTGHDSNGLEPQEAADRGPAKGPQMRKWENSEVGKEDVLAKETPLLDRLKGAFFGPDTRSKATSKPVPPPRRLMVHRANPLRRRSPRRRSAIRRSAMGKSRSLRAPVERKINIDPAPGAASREERNRLNEAAKGYSNQDTDRLETAVEPQRRNRSETTHGTIETSQLETAEVSEWTGEREGLPGNALEQVLQESRNTPAYPSVEEADETKQNTETSRKSSKKKSTVTAAKHPSNKIESVAAAKVQVIPFKVPTPPVPRLSYGLDRVLFNPGVYHLQDPRSRIYNFDPYLEKIMPAVEFDFTALNDFIRPSEDPILQQAAQKRKVRYFSSTSGITNILKQFHFLISQWRELTLSMLSKGFEESSTSFTAVQQAPSSAFLRYRDGRYGIDNDFTRDFETILTLVGRSMEKLFTLPKSHFEQYRKSNTGKGAAQNAAAHEAHHYTLFDKILIRSQLDAYDPRVPGTGVFDIKTRAVLPVRMDLGSRGGELLSYELKQRLGTWESFEREYYDMIRAALLKYSMQVRLGRMDGIFVAYHNVERIFGFQYLPLEEMDLALHGQVDRTLGDQELNTSISILGDVLDRAIKRFPKQSLRLHFDSRGKKVPFMYIFIEPVPEEKLQRLQERAKKRRDDMAQAILNPDPSAVEEYSEPPLPNGWTDLKERVREEVERDDVERDDVDTDGAKIADAGHVDAAQPPSDLQVIELLEERLSQLQTAIQLLKAKSEFVKYGLERLDDFEDIPGEHDASSDRSHTQVMSLIDETNQIEQEFNALLEARESHQTEDVELRKRVDGMRSPLKHVGLALRRQLTAIDRMVSTVQERGNTDAKRGNTRNGTKTTNATSNTAPASDPKSPELQHEDMESSEAKSKEASANTTATIVESAQSQPAHDIEGLEFETEEEPDFPYEPKELLAFTLSIRNRVNGQYVTRPSDLKPKDNWTVEYDLSVIEDEEQARDQYKKSRVRQERTLGKRDEADLEAWYESAYMRKIYEIAERGKNWRKEMDRVDEKVGVRVVDGAVGKERRRGGRKRPGTVTKTRELKSAEALSKPSTVLKNQVQEKVQGVDDYLDKLYKQG